MKITEKTKSVTAATAVNPNDWHPTIVGPAGERVTVGAALAAKSAAIQTEKEKTQEIKINQFADQIIAATARVGVIYLDLCKYIRVNEISPKKVSHLLLARGFNKVRVSEINRVSNAADDKWSQFEAGTIGFKKVLELERGNVVEAVADAMGLVKNDAAEGLETLKNITPVAKPIAGGSAASGDEEEADMVALERACKRALQLAEKLAIRSKKVNIGNGYYVQISKDKHWKKPVSKPETKAAPSHKGEEQDLK